MPKRFIGIVLYVALGIMVVFLWLVVDYAYRSEDEQVLRIIQIVQIAVILIVVLINGIKILKETLDNR